MSALSFGSLVQPFCSSRFGQKYHALTAPKEVTRNIYHYKSLRGGSQLSASCSPLEKVVCCPGLSQKCSVVFVASLLLYLSPPDAIASGEARVRTIFPDTDIIEIQTRQSVGDLHEGENVEQQDQSEPSPSRTELNFADTIHWLNDVTGKATDELNMIHPPPLKELVANAGSSTMVQEIQGVTKVFGNVASDLKDGFVGLKGTIQSLGSDTIDSKDGEDDATIPSPISPETTQPTRRAEGLSTTSVVNHT